MLWFEHPAYARVCQETISALKLKPARLKRLRPMVFLCGGKDSSRRSRLSEYLQKHSDFLIFYAEDVFESLIRSEPNANALELEQELAHLADAVVIIAESAGTFAELGAFAINDNLRHKLLTIADKSFEMNESFLKVGPLRWADKDSAFGPTLWVDFAVILTSADQVKHRLEAGIRRPSRIDVKNVVLRTSRRHLLFLLVLLLDVFGPLSAQRLGVLLEQIVGPLERREVHSLLGLAEALNLAKDEHFEGEVIYFRWQQGGQLGRMTGRTPFAIASMRARVLGVMQCIPSATRALDFLAEKQSNAA
jgi:hypothetical protein